MVWIYFKTGVAGRKVYHYVNTRLTDRISVALKEDSLILSFFTPGVKDPLRVVYSIDKEKFDINLFKDLFNSILMTQANIVIDLDKIVGPKKIKQEEKE